MNGLCPGAVEQAWVQIPVLLLTRDELELIRALRKPAAEGTSRPPYLEREQVLAVLREELEACKAAGQVAGGAALMKVIKRLEG